jgi:hypothetical protein
MLDTVPATIRAMVGPKVLTRAPELFPLSLRTILIELLQNSRRAGATHVAIDYTTTKLDEDKHETTIRITDDGAGVEDPQILLTFGGSGWSEEINHREMAAGMGLYALARLGCTVRSRSWKVELTPETFVGAADAVIQTAEPIHGTTVEFTYPGAVCAPIRYHEWGDPAPKNELDAIVRFYPIPTTINGEKAHQADFLADAVSITTWKGLRIGVMQSQYHPTAFRLDVNFHGLVLENGLELTAVRDIDAGNRLYARHHYVRVDVVDCPALRLVLPARDRVVGDAFLKRLRTEAYRAIYKHIATLPEHGLPYANHAQAARLGVTLREPRISLLLWSTRVNDDVRCPDQQIPGTKDIDDRGIIPDLAQMNRPVVVVDPPQSFDHAIDITLHHALQAAHDAGHPLPFVLVSPEPAFAGYPAYNALPRLTGLLLRAKRRDAWRTIALDQATDQSTEAKVELRLAISTDGEISHTTLPAQVLLWNAETYCSVDDVPLAVDRAANPTALACALYDATFSYSDDGDTYDTQSEYADREAAIHAIQVLKGAAEAQVARALEALRDAAWALRCSPIRRIAIDIRPRRGRNAQAEIKGVVTLTRGRKRRF